VELELLETAREADRQKKFVERSAKNLQHRLKQNSLDAMRSGQRRLMENASLMYECNELRASKKRQVIHHPSSICEVFKPGCTYTI
jgi:hypothetical protein